VTITCTTADAATRALAVLIDARLMPRRDFHIEGADPFTPPVTFTVRVILPGHVLGQLRAIPDTIIA
jgi:hypothetical protein